MKLPEDFNLSQHFQRLEQIIAHLEGDEHDLEQSLQCFEEGMKNIQACRLYLTQAEQKVQWLNTQSQTEHAAPITKDDPEDSVQ